MADREEQVIFGLSPPDAQGNVTLFLMMPPKSWEHMQSGLAHDFDLSKVGIPIHIVMGRCASHADGMKMLSERIKMVTNMPVVDLREVDFKINGASRRR